MSDATQPLSPDYPTDVHDDATQPAQVAETPAEVAAVPEAPATPAAVDHHSAIAALMPSEMERDNLAARIIASGGTEGVALDVHGPNADQLAGHVAGIQGQLQQTADEFVKGQGIDVADFYRFVHFQGPAAVRSVALTLFHSKGDAAYALTPLIHEYRRTSAGRRTR
jgi:hypothetical protein